MVYKGLLDRTGLDPALIDDVITGCAFPEAEQGLNISRTASVLGGVPLTVPAATICRYCSSGAEAIHIAAGYIAAGMYDIVLAGGVDCQSLVPLGGVAPDRAMNSNWYKIMSAHPQAHTMIQTAQYLAEKYDIPRADLDEYAFNSHRKASAAAKAGKFKEYIIPVTVKNLEGQTVVFEDDDCIRHDGTLEKMKSLQGICPPITKGFPESRITAGNSCPVNDGAGAVLLMSAEKAKALGYAPYVKIRAMASAGCGPWEMGYGPVPSTKKCLEKAGMTIGDIDLIEMNEAFASQVLVDVRELGIDMEKLNVNGGAIAIGHPFGATGCRLMTMITRELKEQSGAATGLITMCVGGGQGTTTIVEKV
jgi:acetyl-CoA acyltransferase